MQPSTPKIARRTNLIHKTISVLFFLFGCAGSSLLYSGFSLVAVSRGCSLVVVHGLFIAVASLVAEHGALGCTGFSSSGTWVQEFWFLGSRAQTGSIVVHGLTCPEACGIFPDLGLNLCLLHWLADSLPWSHQGSPAFL